MHHPCTAAITGLYNSTPMLGTPCHMSRGASLMSAPDRERAFAGGGEDRDLFVAVGEALPRARADPE